MQENPALQRYKTYQITSLVDTQITPSSVGHELGPGLQELQKGPGLQELQKGPGLQELQKGPGLTRKWKKRDARTDACELWEV